MPLSTPLADAAMVCINPLAKSSGSLEDPGSPFDPPLDPSFDPLPQRATLVSLPPQAPPVAAVDDVLNELLGGADVLAESQRAKAEPTLVPGDDNSSVWAITATRAAGGMGVYVCMHVGVGDLGRQVAGRQHWHHSCRWWVPLLQWLE